MKKINILFVICCTILYFTTNVCCQEEASVVCVEEQNSKLIKPCKFPFIFKERLFDKCTDYTDKKGKIWCSTNITKDGKHVTDGGYWGYCETNNATSCTQNKVLCITFSKTLYFLQHY